MNHIRPSKWAIRVNKSYIGVNFKIDK